jgi:hypothetical protein
MTASAEREATERKRRERLAASLRENLKRRKAQQRGRAKLDATADGGALTRDASGGQTRDQAATAGKDGEWIA